MSMAQLTEYGKCVKKALIDREQNQQWLEREIRNKTGLFVDSGYLFKIFTGQRKAPKIVTAINEILGLQDARETEDA